MGDRPNAVGVADLNSDGIADLFTTGDSGVVSYRLYDETFGFASIKEIRIGRLPIEALLVHLNEDNNIDIITPNRDSDDISVILGQAS